MRILRADDFYFPVRFTHIPERLKRGDAITGGTIEWGELLGIIGRNSASRDHYKAMLCGPLATLGWPRATAEYQQIISDTLCTVFAIDDMCDGDAPEETRSMYGSAEALFSDLVEFWFEGDDFAPPSFGTPLYTAMRDLRYRLIKAGASELWIRRFAQSMQGWFDGVRKEKAFKKHEIVPDADALMHLRPDSGAVYLFMNFIEGGNHIEVPEDAWRDERFERLRSIAGRLIVYPNEIWSFKKESEGGHSINIITSLMLHAGMQLEQAIVYVAEMHNSEMISFDELAKSILASPDTDARVRIYIRGLQHLMFGAFVWGLSATRYSKEFFASEAISGERSSASQSRLRCVAPSTRPSLRRTS